VINLVFILNLLFLLNQNKVIQRKIKQIKVIKSKWSKDFIEKEFFSLSFLPCLSRLSRLSPKGLAAFCEASPSGDRRDEAGEGKPYDIK
jgi:hypothetical protein